jgi:glycosyltransferase involved in cell wall biosynthesis
VSGRPAQGVRVFYGHDRVPGPGEPVAGGTAKFQRLATRFPNHPVGFSILYLGSTWLPRDLGPLLWHAQRHRIPVVLNQNGVGYPGWAGDETDEFNEPIGRVLEAADHVLYQSEFCKHSADEWVRPPSGSWEVLHNAVDVERFAPAARPPEGGPVLLLGGDQTQVYRLELGLRTLAALLRTQPDARMLVTGRLVTRVLETARVEQAAIPAVPLRDTVSEVDAGRIVRTLDRTRLVAVQTPQVFADAILRRAHASAEAAGRDATDDASLLEASGTRVAVVPGDPMNLKLTEPADLAMFEFLLRRGTS